MRHACVDAPRSPSDVTTSTKPGETLIGLVRAEEVGPADEEGAEEETDAPIPEAQYD